MKTEAEKIRDFEIKACFACSKVKYDPWTLECICSIKGNVSVMSCCSEFEPRKEEK